MGFRPSFINSGFRYFVITSIIFVSLMQLSWFPTGVNCYLMLVNLSGALSVYGMAVALALMVKGYLAPSKGDHGSSGNPLFDFYWGLEVYPRIGKYFDFKLWSISRFGMTSWVFVILVCWKAQFELHGLNHAMNASSIIQIIYLLKFFWWEYGYMHTIDITVDRAGFYLCWGCISFLPFFLTSTSIYQVENPSSVSPELCLFYLLLGILCTFLTYWIDCERLRVRDSQGKCKVWGKPAEFIRATHIDENGRKKENLLVTSGFWGTVRHPNYLVELTANVAWMFPCGFNNLTPYLWGIMLLVLIIHRAGRDDEKCRKKYVEHWPRYCRQVKYVLIPGVY